MTIDQFLKSEKPVTGMTDQACDTYGVHSHAFIIDLFGNGKTSTNAGHFHVIHNGIVGDVADDARTVHNHNLLRVPQAPNTPSYGLELTNPLSKDKDGLPNPLGTDKYGYPEGWQGVPCSKPALFIGLGESLDDILSGDPSLAWSKIMAQASPEEIEVLDAGLAGKIEDFRAKFNNLIDDILKIVPDGRYASQLKSKAMEFGGQPLSPALILSPEEFASAFRGNPAASMLESEYAEKAKEYMSELGNELQIIILMNEGKEYSKWAEENREDDDVSESAKFDNASIRNLDMTAQKFYGKNFFDLGESGQKTVMDICGSSSSDRRAIGQINRKSKELSAHRDRASKLPDDFLSEVVDEDDGKYSKEEWSKDKKAVEGAVSSVSMLLGDIKESTLECLRVSANEMKDVNPEFKKRLSELGGLVFKVQLLARTLKDNLKSGLEMLKQGKKPI